MLIKFLGGNAFRIQTKTAEIVTGKETHVGDVPLAGPGEYEVADIQIKGYKDAYLFSAENLSILYVDNPAGLSDEQVKAIEEDIDLLLLTLDHDTEHVRHAVQTMNNLDPKVTVPALEASDHPFCREIGGCPEAIAELKLTKKDLTEEERKTVVLDARSPVRH